MVVIVTAGTLPEAPIIPVLSNTMPPETVCVPNLTTGSEPEASCVKACAPGSMAPEVSTQIVPLQNLSVPVTVSIQRSPVAMCAGAAAAVV